MLRGPTDYSKDSEIERVGDSTQSTQHGLQESDTSLSPQLRVELGRAQDGQATSDPAAVAAESNADPSQAPLGRLNTSEQRTGSPVDKILEHEDALSRSSRKGRYTSTFTYLSRSNKSEAGCVGLSDLSNGMILCSVWRPFILKVTNILQKY